MFFPAIFMFLACVIYPGGWDAEVVRNLCGSSSYDSGNCYIQWTYYLAIVAIFDAIILAILAFVLAVRQVKLLPWQGKTDKIRYRLVTVAIGRGGYTLISLEGSYGNFHSNQEQWKIIMLLPLHAAQLSFCYTLCTP